MELRIGGLTVVQAAGCSRSHPDFEADVPTPAAQLGIDPAI